MPRAAAKSATPIAATGRIARSRMPFSSVRARLFVQRSALRCFSARRGATVSHSAMAARMARKTPSRTGVSWLSRKVSMIDRSDAPALATPRECGYSIQVFI